MQRIACAERPDWREHAAEVGFDFNTIDGEPYWDESAYYGFTLDEIERDLEGPSAELDRMCRELVARAVADERMLRILRIPERFWTFIAASWKRGDPSLYGRFDLRYDGRRPAKLLEYNADTPTTVLEAAILQWHWLTDLYPGDDQWNSLHEKLVERWSEIKGTLPGSDLHFTWSSADATGEDNVTTAYLQ